MPTGRSAPSLCLLPWEPGCCSLAMLRIHGDGERKEGEIPGKWVYFGRQEEDITDWLLRLHY